MDANSVKTRIGLKDILAKEITSGNYSFNQAFPGIHQIAQRYHVSYLTASRAMKLLQQEGYLRCENGIGHFVNYISENMVVSQKKVNIITSRRFYELRRPYFTDALKLFRSNGWNVQLFQCTGDDISSVAQEINSPDVYSVICGLNVSWECFQASFQSVAKRVLILGILSGSQEVTSIISNEYDTIRQAMEHFAKTGRRNIGILALSQKQELEALRIGAWRSMVLASGHTPDWAVKHCFSCLDQDDAKDKGISARLEEWISDIAADTDGLIVPVYQLETIRACLKQGIRIPEEISIILIALSSPELKNVESYLPDGELPPVEVLDHNYAGHFQCALEILEGRFSSGKNAEGCWYFCPPGKIQRCRAVSK